MTKTIKIQQVRPSYFVIRHNEHGAWAESFRTVNAAIAFVLSQGYSREDIITA